MGILNILFVILTIMLTMFIFSMSSQTGEESGGLSKKIADVVVDILYQDYDDYDEDKQNEIMDKVHFLVRKTAHFGEYGLLATLVLSSIITGIAAYRKGLFREIWKKKCIVFAVITQIIVTVYASTDEFHQGFVEGRGPSVKDVFIDSAGGLTAIIIYSIIVYFGIVCYNQHANTIKKGRIN